ncbi:MAG: choice-of-anchor D domain-containing protein, partial [bacterium]|nr:choice-of-anchor D domain-containing protein [bacterium]
IANATGGENFTIGTQTGPSPITDGTNNLVNGTSNTYITPDLAQPAIVSWSTPGIINNGDIISVTFSENVNNSQNPDNYRINYSGPGSITMNNSISYNSGTFTASLPMALSGTDGSTFTIETVTGTTPIQDNNGNTLINGVSGTYTSAVIDVNVPIITQFQLTSANPSSSQDITFNLTGSDNVAITSWMVNESATPPSASDPAWVATKPTAYTLSNGYGTKNVYAWAKDAAGNVSIVNSNSHFSVQYANIIPAITEFLLMSMPSQSEDIAIGLRDNNANSWLINESPATPSPTDPNWLGSVPESYSLSSGNGVKTVYAWAMNDFNAKSNITSALTDASHFNVGINIPQNFDQLALMLIDDSVGNTYNTDIYPYSTFDLGSYHTAGVSKRYNFRITNQGTGDLNIEQIIDTNGTEPGIYFDQGSFQPISLKSGETYDFHITYSPQYETSFTAVFRIKSNDPDYRDFGFYLTGEGVNNPIIESFSSPNGSSVQNRDITVECDMGGGNYWLVNESITPPPPMQVGDEGWKSYQPQGGYDSQNYTLSPGYGTKKVYAWGVKWDSQAMTCGPVSDLTNSSQFQIELTAANPAPVISVKAFLEKGYVNGITVNPNSTLDTGTITRQEAQEGHWTYFTIQNASAVNNLEVTAITMEMVSGDGFEFTGKPLLPATLAPNTEGLYLSIMFKNSNPPQQAEARITIQNNDPDNENFTFTVTVACSG